MDDRLMYRRELFIGGAWEAPAGGGHLGVVSPSSEEVIGEVPAAGYPDIDRAVAAARRAFDEGPWPRMTPAERAEVLARAADGLRKREADIAGVAVDEMGCAISQAPMAQTGMVAALFDYYAALSRDFEFERYVVNGARAGLVTSEAAGVVAVIVPWNAPVTLASWKTAPALAAGCTVVIKPAPEAPLSNFILAEALEEAGVPRGVVSVVPAGREAGEHLVTHPGVDKVAFTGSTAAGKRIMSLCGEQVKRVSLELGGKSAAIILDDADVAAVMNRLVHGAMHMSGQVCGAHTRVLVPRPVYGQAVDAAAAVAAHVPVGDPHDPATLVGPLVAERQRTRVEGYISLALGAGARVAAGGAGPLPCRAAGTSSRRSSLTWTTRCGWPGKRSSGRCCALFLTTARTTRCGSPTTRRTGSRAGSGRGMPRGGCESPSACVPEASRLTGPIPRSRWCRSAGSRSPVSGGNSGLRGWRTSSNRGRSGFRRNCARRDRSCHQRPGSGGDCPVRPLKVSVYSSSLKCGQRRR